jgi:hypothetical protein
VESLRGDPPAVLERVHAAGFDASREEFLDRYGAERTPEQLDKIAAGTDPAVVGGVTAAVVAVWPGASAAAVVV